MMLVKALITHALVTGLNDKERGFSCPVCGARAWLGDTSPGSQKFATPECRSCGYTLLFSVDVLKAKTEELLAEQELDSDGEFMNKDGKAVKPVVKLHDPVGQEANDRNQKCANQTPKRWDVKFVLSRFFNI